MQGLWLLLALNGLTSTQAAAADCLADLCWSVSPQICVTEQTDQACRTVLQVNWLSEQTQNVCLYLAEQQLYCWQPATQGSWQQAINWQNADVTLRDMNQQVLLQTQLQVQSRQPARRRRLGGPWSIF